MIVPRLLGTHTHKLLRADGCSFLFADTYHESSIHLRCLCIDNRQPTEIIRSIEDVGVNADSSLDLTTPYDRRRKEKNFIVTIPFPSSTHLTRSLFKQVMLIFCFASLALEGVFLYEKGSNATDDYQRASTSIAGSETSQKWVKSLNWSPVDLSVNNTKKKPDFCRLLEMMFVASQESLFKDNMHNIVEEVSIWMSSIEELLLNISQMFLDKWMNIFLINLLIWSNKKTFNSLKRCGRSFWFSFFDFNKDQRFQLSSSSF